MPRGTGGARSSTSAARHWDGVAPAAATAAEMDGDADSGRRARFDWAATSGWCACKHELAVNQILGVI